MASTKINAADVQITGVLDMRKHAVKNLETDLSVYPLEDHHGASKIYVDNLRTQIIAGLPDTADNEEY